MDRKRIWFLVSALVDDNEDIIESTSRVLAGTQSDKVAKNVMKVFEKHRNGRITMVHEQNSEHTLPTELVNLNGMLKEKKEDSVDSHVCKIFDMVDFKN